MRELVHTRAEHFETSAGYPLLGHQNLESDKRVSSICRMLELRCSLSRTKFAWANGFITSLCLDTAGPAPIHYGLLWDGLVRLWQMRSDRIPGDMEWCQLCAARVLRMSGWAKVLFIHEWILRHHSQYIYQRLLAAASAAEASCSTSTASCSTLAAS